MNKKSKYNIGKTSCELLPFSDTANQPQKEKSIPFELNEYIALVDWSGRVILHNKRGSISSDIPPILYRLGIGINDWVNHVNHFEKQFPTVAGSFDKLHELAEQTSRRWIKGVGSAFQLLPT